MIPPATVSAEAVKAREAAAKALKLELQTTPVSGVNEFEAAIAAMAKQRVDALIVTGAALYTAHAGRIAALAARQGIPTLGNVNFADSGGLMGYGANTLNNYRRAAYFIDRIFKGAKPGDLPIEQPTRFELVINMKTARALGIRVPETILVRADRVIE